MAAARQALALVTNIFRPHDIPLAAPLNHPALVKTSVQPSFISSNFSPFAAAEALRASDISPVSSVYYIQILVVEQQRK
jgi:hypothetical protein